MRHLVGGALDVFGFGQPFQCLGRYSVSEHWTPERVLVGNAHGWTTLGDIPLAVGDVGVAKRRSTFVVGGATVVAGGVLMMVTV